VTVYSVYARQGDAPIAVADRFSWSAALVAPVHALVNGLWVMLGLWVVKVAVLAALSLWIGGGAAFWLYVLLAAWFGFAAAGFAHRKAARAGTYEGEWVAVDADAALVSYLSRPAVS
jgi:hypothetical protein